MPLDSIAAVIHQFEQQPRWRSRGQFRQILNHWAAIVGENVARQAAPVRLDQDVLHVAVVNPMWAQTLMLERLRILAKLNDRLHLHLSDIRFSSGDWYRQGRSPQPRQLSPSAPESLPQWLRQHPCFEPRTIPRSQQRPNTAEESFDRWAHLTQTLAAQQPRCPQCQCHCPQGELQRWGKCSICAVKGFKGPVGRHEG
jgi:predicted nucleic acid-binding Zn ribbon protein